MAHSCPVAPGLCTVGPPLCDSGPAASPLLSLDLLFPGSLVLHSEFLDETQLYSLYFSFFFPILYIIKVSFSILFYFLFIWKSEN